MSRDNGQSRRVEDTGGPPSPPRNPWYSGVTGQLSLIITVSGLALFALFLILDTVQFIYTGHESPIFTAISRGAGGIGIGGLVATLIRSYLTTRK